MHRFIGRMSRFAATVLIAAAASAAHADAKLVTVLHDFGSDVAAPFSALIQGADGNFYGTTDGRIGLGAVYKVTPAGAYSTLAAFDGGAGSPGSLVQTADGNFYGMTSDGGASEMGTVFKVTPSGSLTTLVTFDGSNGKYPGAGLTLGSDGNLYGATRGGGANDRGTIFRMTPDGALTTLVTFNGANGTAQQANLMQASDGNFYGTTGQGGTSGSNGPVFKMTPDGVLTTLASFDGTNGANPLCALVQGSDGNFYGTTLFGGASNQGTVFRITPAGVLTTLVTFDGSNGAGPWGGLVLGSDGNFYGETGQGGPNNYGSAFRMTPAGVLTTLVKFLASEGVSPTGGLIQGSDGNFYGTALSGGASGYGTVFKLSDIPPPAWLEPPTPADNAQLTLTIGSSFSQSLRASADATASRGTTVHIGSGAVPAGLNVTSFDGNPGTATIQWTPAANQAGDYTLTFTAMVNNDPPISSAPRRLKLHVVKRTSSLKASPEILQITPTEIHLRMKATLTDTATSLGLGGKTVAFSTPTGRALCSAVSNSAGVAACGTVVTFVRTTLNLGYVASFAGDSGVQGSTAQGALIQ